MSFRYEKRHGSYYLIEKLAPLGGRDREDIRLMSDSIAVLIDVEEGIMLKHGAPELVRKKHSEYAANGFDDGYVLVESDRWDVAVLNKFLANAAAAGQWWREQQHAAAKLLPDPNSILGTDPRAHDPKAFVVF